MKKRILVLLLGTSWFIIPNCSVFHSGGYGYITTSVRFPQKGYSIKVIPEGTKVVSVEVTGVGLTSSIKFDLTDSEFRRVVKDVPIGQKFVSAVAKNATGKILAAGQNSVEVLANVNNVVEVDLKVTGALPIPSVIPSLLISPSALLSALPSLIPGASLSPVPSLSPFQSLIPSSFPTPDLTGSAIPSLIPSALVSPSVSAVPSVFQSVFDIIFPTPDPSVPISPLPTPTPIITPLPTPTITPLPPTGSNIGANVTIVGGSPLPPGMSLIVPTASPL